MRNPTHSEIAADMGMSEVNFTNGNKLFRPMHMSRWPMFMTNIQFGMRRKKTVQKKKWAMKS